jgi:hypothetical protein
MIARGGKQEGHVPGAEPAPGAAGPGGPAPQDARERPD